eukprot:2780516-Ditylum_brightwellii.AAC.2
MLHIVFEVKHNLQRKARRVASGHLIDVMDTPIYSSTVKSISVQFLHVFVAKAGPKFGKHKGKCITRFNNDVW